MTPMTDVDWSNLKRLKREGAWWNWGDTSKIAREVVLELDALCEHLDTTAIVTSGTAGNHMLGSFHYPTDDRPGCAIDFLLPKFTLRQLPDVLFDVLRFGFHGVGIYSAWRASPAGVPIGGFHVDWRPAVPRAIWLADPRGVYLALNQANLRENFK